MKKKLFLIITLCLIVALCLCLVACDKDNDENDNTVTPSGDNTQTSTGDSGNGGSSGSGSGSGSGSQGGGSGSGSQQGGGSQGGGDQGNLSKTLPTSQNIITAIGPLFKVTATNLQGSAPTVVSSDGTYDYISNPSVTFRKKTGDNLYCPYGDLRNDKYHRMGTPTFYPEEALRTVLTSGNVGGMFYYAGATISYQSETATTEVLGRPAKKYTNTTSNGNSTYTEIIIIDDATGACLKHDGATAATDGFTGNAVKPNFVVSELEYGATNTVARNFLDGMIAKIDVYEWDTTYIAAVGLDAIDAPQGDIWRSEWNAHTDRNDAAPDWEVEYKLFSDTQSQYQDYVESIALALYNAGAKDDGGVQDFVDLYSIDPEEDTIYFYGYIVGNTYYRVEYHADYITAATSHYWDIEINIYYD